MPEPAYWLDGTTRIPARTTQRYERAFDCETGNLFVRVCQENESLPEVSTQDRYIAVTRRANHALVLAKLRRRQRRTEEVRAA